MSIPGLFCMSFTTLLYFCSYINECKVLLGLVFRIYCYCLIIMITWMIIIYSYNDYNNNSYIKSEASTESTPHNKASVLSRLSAVLESLLPLVRTLFRLRLTEQIWLDRPISKSIAILRLHTKIRLAPIRRLLLILRLLKIFSSKLWLGQAECFLFQQYRCWSVN